MAKKEIQFGIMFFAASEETLQRDKYRLVLEAAKFGDRNGFSSIWLPERHFATLGGLYPNPAVLHAALAVLTERIHLRAGSVVLPLHHPLRVAEEWSLVDNLSHGRVGVSFASGWNPNDFAFFPDKYETRSDELFRMIPIVRDLWRGQPLDITSGLGKKAKVRIYPRPVQPELPTWVTAARSPSTFIRAGEIGANVLTHLLDQDVEDVAKRISLYREARARNGHSPESGSITVMLHTFVGEQAEVAREQGRKPYCEFLKSNVELLKALAASRERQADLDSLSPAETDDFLNFLYDRFVSSRSLIGSPETCFDLVVKLKAVGVDEIACLLDFGPPYDLVLQNLTHLNRLREICSSPEFDRSVDRLRAESPLSLQVEKAAEIGREAAPADNALQRILERCVDVISGAEFYSQLKESGLDVDPSLRGVQQIWRRDGEALGEVEFKDGHLEEAGGISAVLLDSCLQVSLAALPVSQDDADTAKRCYVPWGLAKVDLQWCLSGRLFSHAVLTSQLDGGGTEINGELRILTGAGEPLTVISGLQLRESPVALSAEDEIEQWFYELRWEQKALAPGESADGPTTWLVLADRSEIGRAFAGRLQERGKRVLLIDSRQLPHADTASVETEFLFREIERATQDALNQSLGRRCVVVFLRGIDSASPDEMTEESLQTDQIAGSGCALYLIQLIAGLQANVLPKLWLVTRGGQRVNDESVPIQIMQSPLWGLGRTCAIEHPELWGGIVDLDPEAGDQENANSLLDAIFAEALEDQVAFRKAKAFVPRLVKGGKLVPKPLVLQPDGGYLITGGLKGIGFEVARWLAKKGARYLFLVGRSPLPPREHWDQLEPNSPMFREIDKIRVIESLGATVTYAAVDVSSPAGLKSLMETVGDQNVGIRGVIHAASVWKDEQGSTLIRPLLNLDITALQEVFRPKLVGSWLLHKAFENIPLDFFVCFSSAASLTGSAGQGNYAAASVFLDALAHYRTQLGRHGLSINWGPVSGAGFGATRDGLKVHEYWEANGLHRIGVDQLLKVLEALLPQSLTQMGVMNVDWEKLSHFFPAIGKAPWARYLVAPSIVEARSNVLDELLELPADERREVVVQHVRQQVAEVMGLSELPDPRKKLFEMGMDSLMALELKSRLQAILGTEIRVTAVFNYPTIDALAAYLVKDVLSMPVPSAVRQASEPVRQEEALSRIKALSEAEVDRLLAVREQNLEPLL